VSGAHSPSEKKRLAEEVKLTEEQVGYWFINARVRIWKPMIGESPLLLLLLLLLVERQLSSLSSCRRHGAATGQGTSAAEAP
jgi:hypothetical protein